MWNIASRSKFTLKAWGILCSYRWIKKNSSNVTSSFIWILRKIHWDFNANRTLASVLPVVDQLEREFPVVGFIEDPVERQDIEGWRTVRKQSKITIVQHVPQLGGCRRCCRGWLCASCTNGKYKFTFYWRLSRNNFC